MARNKHSAALFEVFHGTNQADHRGASALRTPRWWFKGGDKSQAAAGTSDPNDPTAGAKLTSPLLAPRLAAVEESAEQARLAASKLAAVGTSSLHSPTLAASTTGGGDASNPLASNSPTIATPPAPMEHPTSAAAPAPPSPRSARDIADPTRRPALSGHAARRPFVLDRHSREVSIHLQFSTAVAIAFGLMLTIAVTYVIGRRTGSKSELPASAPLAATDDTRAESSSPAAAASSVQPGALEVNHRPAVAVPGNSRPLRVIGDEGSDRDAASPEANSVHGLSTDPEPPARSDLPRIIGLNYIIVQSYRNEQGAIEARDFLIKNGVPCTAEKAPPTWAANPNWYCVVTTRGFEHIRTADYINFRKQIEKLGEKFANSGQFKHFEPFPYSWK